MKIRWVFLISVLCVCLFFTTSGTVQADEVNNILFETEDNSDFMNAHLVYVNTFCTGNLSKESDNDCYKFVLDKPGSVQIQISNNPDLEDYHWSFGLYYQEEDGIKRQLDRIDAGYATRTNMDKKRLPAGIYFIEVNHGSNKYSNTDYKFIINYIEESEDNFEQEFNDSFSKANNINLNSTYIGNLSKESDNDCYKFVLDKPGSVQIQISNNPDLENYHWSFGLYFQEEDGIKRQLDRIDVGYATRTNMDKKRLPAGIYFIEVNHGSNKYSNTDYKCKISYTEEHSENFEQEFNSSFSKANKIKLGNTYTGNLSSDSDKDCYKLTIKKSINSLICLTQAEDGEDASWMLKIFEVDSDGNRRMLDIFTLGTQNSNKKKYTLSAGTYYFEISFDYRYYNKDYRLTVKENKPGKVKNLKVTNSTNKSIEISWDKVKDANTYCIYRSTKKDGKYELVAIISKNKTVQKNLKSGKTYYYKVCAVNNDDYKGDFSTVLSVKVK